MKDFRIRAAATLLVVRAVEARGIAPAVLFREAGVAPVSGDTQAWVSLARHFAVWRAAMSLLQDPGFPIDVGRSVTLEAFDVAGYAALSAPDLAGVADVLERYSRIYTNAGGTLRERDTDGVWLIMPPSGPLPLAARAATEGVLAQQVQIARLASGVQLVPLAVEFRHRAPRDLRAHETFFGVTPRFERPRARWLVAHADLGRATVKADPALHRVLVRHADAALASLPKKPSTALAVRHAIAGSLPSGATLESVAKQLVISSRTLRRRLTDEGETFRGLLDEVRHEFAARYLQEDRLSLPEVALLLGFSDDRAFRRAYKRWTGHAPRGGPA
ncbi:MAG: AraC family transcriptional regulator [Sandaracinaceae bacterium]